ncbi:MAG: STM4015 family protein [Polyangiaceae bacterium]
MEKRELQFMDGKSSKFWRIELDGACHTVTYGRIGTEGTSQTKEFSSPAEARKSHDKLLSQKLAKGYVDAASGGAAGGGAAAGAGDEVPFIAFPCTTGSNGTGSHASNFMGLRVSRFSAGKKPGDPKKTAYFFGSDYENDTFTEDLEAFLESDVAAEARALVLGPWAEELYDVSSAEAVKLLVANAKKLPKLAGLFVGDIVQEENEISWIHQCDLSPLFAAFPKLLLLRARGGQDLALSKAKHVGLRALALETGGMNASVVRSILSGDFPALEYLELWLGTEEYGGTCTVEDLQPLFKGKKFPKLRYLGLRNCDFVDDIATVVVNSPLLQRIETLDLSLGTLSDVGGRALLQLPKDSSLKKLDLSHHFMSKQLMKELKGLKLAVDVSEAESPDDEWRFVAVGE